MGKGETAEHAPRRREKGDPAPAPAAQRIRLLDDLTAGKAARRQHAVDDGPADSPQSVGRPGGKSCRCLHHDTSSGRDRGVNPPYRVAGLDGMDAVDTFCANTCNNDRAIVDYDARSTPVSTHGAIS
jgi:hypothetical protein